MARLPNVREARILELLSSGELYGRQIRDRYQTDYEESFALGSLYTTLGRMIDKGYLAARLEAPKPGERDGYHRKYFRLTGAGAEALDAFRHLALTSGMPDYA